MNIIFEDGKTYQYKPITDESREPPPFPPRRYPVVVPDGAFLQKRYLVSILHSEGQSLYEQEYVTDTEILLSHAPTQAELMFYITKYERYPHTVASVKEVYQIEFAEDDDD